MAQPPIIPTSSPYHLTQNETPALLLVSQPLAGQNYHQWARSVQVALMSKNKYPFVDGSIVAPDPTDNMYNQWERCNNMVMSWLNHALSPPIAKSIMWIDKAYLVWADLKERYSQTDSLRILELRREIHSFKQGNQSVTEYHTNLKILYDELMNLRPMPKCTCRPACSCNAFKAMRDQNDADQVMTFLQGLNDTYTTICSQILLMEPFPSLNKVFGLSIQHERQMGFVANRNEEGVPFAGFTNAQGRQNNNRSQGSGGGNQNKRGTYNKNSLCTYCGKTGHTEEICFKKHGYPQGYSSRFKNNNRGSQSRANATTNNGKEESGMDSGDDEMQNNGESFTLTKEQYQRLVALLPQNNNKASTSGASANTLVRGEISGNYKVGEDWLG